MQPATTSLPEVAQAAEELTHLGFLLVSPFPPGRAPSRLFVSLRPRPTLQHFDAETIEYWGTGSDRRGHPEKLVYGARLPVTGSFAWGKIQLVDRKGVENEFVSMGGQLQADRVAPDEVVAVFTSMAPILRMGGHSQAEDTVALEMAAFFARMMVPIDFDPGAEQALADADPLTRYAAFIAYERDRYAGHSLLRSEHPREAEILTEEAERLRRTQPGPWDRGHRLLADLGLHG